MLTNSLDSGRPKLNFLHHPNRTPTPIDLSLIYTCRSIANDCKNLSLSVNTIHFSTLYREDWRSLAGCFNLVATYYYVLQQDIVLHLAHLITLEMHAQLEKRFPTFRAKLEAERAFHFHVWDNDDGGRTNLHWDPAHPINHRQLDACEFVREFYDRKISQYDHPEHPRPYQGYAQIDEYVEYSPVDGGEDSCDGAYQHWNTYSGEVHKCLPQCLRLIADEYPKEFSDHVYACLPHWSGNYPARDFLDLQFECWPIPSRHQLEIAMDRLDIPDFVWKLPNVWSYVWKSKYNHCKNIPDGHRFEGCEPTLEFDARAREKVMFSAAATAIRFLGLPPNTQRTQIRAIMLQEDHPSVNKMSLHVDGLVPFLRENRLLRIERRINVASTYYNDYSGSEVAMDVLLGGDHSLALYFDSLVPHVSRWLLDTIAVYDEDITAGSLTLVLEADPYPDFCTEGFQKFIHKRIAEGQAVRDCLESGLFKHLTDRQVEQLKREYALDDGFEDAIVQLVNQTSSVFRCAFNPGVFESCQTTVDDTRAARSEDIWEYWVRRDRIYDGWIGRSEVLLGREAFEQVLDLETEDDYLRSRAGDIQQ